MSNLEPHEIIKLQCNILKNIQRSLLNFKKSPKERITLEYLETRLYALESEWKQFTSNNNDLVVGTKEESLKTSAYMVEDMYNETEELYFDYKSLLKVNLNKLSTTNPDTIVTKKSNVKLPDITITKFSGNYSDWPTFRDLFKSLIHRNASLENVQKLQYLKGHVTGEAEQLLRQYQVTEANYQICWDLLEKRYNNKKYLCSCILSKFFSQKRLTTESGSGLKQLYDTTNDCLSALTNIDVDVTSWDVIIIHMLTFKLDPVTRREWELKVQNDTSTTLPTYEQFKTFLESRFRALESLERKSSNSHHNSPKETHAKVHLATEGQTNACEYCSQTHKLCFCKKFGKLTYDQRHEFVSKNRICYNCLGGNHSIKQCESTSTCRLCKKRHHSLLHKGKDSERQGEPKKQLAIKDKEEPDGSGADEAKSDPPPEKKSVVLHSTRSTSSSQVVLATAVVNAKSKAGDYQVIRALLDQGSQASFITENAVQLLRLKKHTTNCMISGLGSDKTMVSKHMVTVKVQSLAEPDCVLEVPSYVLKSITSYLPNKKIQSSEWPELQNINLADPRYNSPNKIDVLLGADVYSKVLKEGLKRSPNETLVAQNTTLGWIVSGLAATDNTPDHQRHIKAYHAYVNEDDVLKKFWEIEEQLTAKEVFSTDEEQRCEEICASTTRRTEEGRYVVKLPFKEENPSCVGSNSREIAFRRFKALERKFSRDSNLKQRYAEVINEYINLGHMSPVKTDDPKNNVLAVYLPHHAVVREDKSTTKVRVVFDASCKYNTGVSLNDTLMIGPTLQPDLRHLILQWRQHPIALVADIVKMYRQVMVAPEDQPFQRIVWREDSKQEIKDYELLTVTFGTASAPYLAVKALQQTSHDEGDKYPLAKDKVLSSFYMDDLLTGSETAEEGAELCRQMTELLKKGGFELQKWNSNEKKILEEIQGNEKDSTRNKKDQKGNEREKSIEIKLEDTVKILGLTWNHDEDEMKYTVNLLEKSASETKRSILSDIARLFDPLGWIAPSVVLAKMFIQKLWLAGIGWDEVVPSDLLTEWNTYRSQLKELTKFHLPRWLGTRKDDTKVELHGFSGASKMAYAGVIYVRIVRSNGDIHVSLLTAKTKVAPIKQRSIPRLELCGAWLVTQLLMEMSKVLNVPKENLHAWTDSTIVLAWLNKHPNHWKTFVANRVSEILMRLDASQWAHVATKKNPADCASRGVQPSHLAMEELWIHGPHFLREKIVEYTKPKTLSTNEEAVVSKNVHVGIVIEDDLMKRYSDLRRLLKIVAYCRRFLSYRRGDRLSVYPKKTEIDGALKCCITAAQSKDFANEIADLKENGCVRSKDSKLKSLTPYLDRDGVLRVGGRLQKSQLAEEAKHPIVLSHDSHLTRLLVADAHAKTMHGGPQLMMNFLRSAYWIIGMKNLVKQHVRNCVICVRNRAEVKHQFMGSLPAVRVTPARPFSRSGVDYAGPINIRTTKGRGHKSYKGYICVFVCMSTRAIHLEVVSDMTTQAFIAAFRRFVARRGHCEQLYSDNGTTFVGASKELSELANIQQAAMSTLAVNGTEWHFIPPHAPNFGGLWEAGVKSTKFHLKRVIGDSTLTYEEMSTLLSQVEACLNSRPITVINTEDPGELQPLTPGHFLIGEPLVVVPGASYEDANVSSLSRWHMVKKMVQGFWRRWSQEYLTTLMNRYKWTNRTPEPKLGDLVLIKEDDLPPSRWMLGRVIEKHAGSDGITRVVSLKTKSSVLKRPTSKLCIIPVSD